MSNPGTPILTLENVGLSYSPHRYLPFGPTKKRFWALKDVSLEVFAGETLGIVGGNGAGKSTLLKLMAGILKPDIGQVSVAGRLQIQLLALQLGFVPYLTGRENMMLSGLLSGYTRRQIRDKMGLIIDFSELDGFIDKPINTYSDGMKARLGFSIAFFTDPDILLVDETLGVGDAEFREKSTSKMRERISSNKTVVIVSHSANLLRQVCNRIVWIRKGESCMQGEPGNVLDAYAQKGR